MIDVFISITGANLFLYKLGMISFLASKPGFQEIKPKVFLRPNTSLPLSHNIYAFSPTNKTNSQNPSLKTSKIYIFNIEYLENRLLEIASNFKNDKLFMSFIDINFLYGFKAANSIFEQPGKCEKLRITSSIQAFNSQAYIINLKLISLYYKLITNYDFFNSSSALIFESLVLTNFTPSLDAEEIKQSLNIYLFKSLIENSKNEKTDIHSTKMDSLLAYWVTDYLFKIENAKDLNLSIEHFNSIAKDLEEFNFFSSLHPDLFTKILSHKDLSEFKLLAPVYQNPRFLQFLCNNGLVGKFENKIFLLNLSQIYQDYCEQNLSIDSSDLQYIDILTSSAQQQLLNEKIPLAKIENLSIKKQKI